MLVIRNMAHPGIQLYSGLNPFDNAKWEIADPVEGFTVIGFFSIDAAETTARDLRERLGHNVQVHLASELY